MKHSVSFFSIVLILLAGCYAPKTLSITDSEKIYEHNVSLSKSELKTKVQSFIAETFNSEKNIININDDNMLSANYTCYLKDFDPLGTVKIFAHVGIIIKYTQTGYKVKFQIKDIFSRTNTKEQTMYSDYWGNYADEVKLEFSNMNVKLHNYIINNNTF